MSDDVGGDDQTPRSVAKRTFMKGLLAGGMALASVPARSGEKAAGDGAEAAPDLIYDVVVIGGGAAGMAAALRAVDHGASVVIVDANYDIGGHAILSGANITLGGGTRLQKKYGIHDTPDLLFKDLTDWSVVERNGMPEYRFNDRALQRALADNMALTGDFLLDNGVPFLDQAPDNVGGHSVGISARRQHHCVWEQGVSLESPSGWPGTALMRALERSARKKGIQFLLNYHMDDLVQDQSGRVVGVRARHSPTVLPGATTPLESFQNQGNLKLRRPQVQVAARKGVVICTGGHTGNVAFRRIFDPRLTEEYAAAGVEYSPQDASGELAALAIGASLWGTANQSTERNGAIRKRPLIGTRASYVHWTPHSPIFAKVGASGLVVSDFANLILVNQVGRRFYDELAGGYPNGSTEGFYQDGYVHGDWRNVRKVPYRPSSYIDAALALNEGSTAPDYGAGPQWAIFDESARIREGWETTAPHVHPQYFFQAQSLQELADKLSACPYQHAAMPAQNLVDTVTRFNEFVAAGKDDDFGRTALPHKIQTPPFYAAWASLVVHDSYTGLRIDTQARVLDHAGTPIAGLYCAGESAGGCSQHGLGRCFTQGFIAGRSAALG